MDAARLEAGQRTITTLAEHFREIKARAAELNASIDPVGRGYFSVTEDEAVEALVIGYSQARSALLELIHEYRDYASRGGSAAHVSFLLAFSGALILIDAARYLRKLVEDRPVVRRKLNQPIPLFGIPGGFYDTVQRSLLRARHAWHLYHAIRYFRDQEQELRRDAGSLQLDAVIEVIDELRPQIEVSMEQFARARLRTRSDQWLRNLGRTVVVRSVYGAQKLIAEMMADRYVRPGHLPRIPDGVASELSHLVRPGDIFVVRKEYALTNYFLPGYWPHAALYLGKFSELGAVRHPDRPHLERRWHRLEVAAGATDHVVIESMKDGVLFRSWVSPLGSDSLVVLRPRLTPEQVHDALGRVAQHEGKGYDFDFDFRRSDRLVCTEVIYRAFEGIGAMSFPLKRRAGRPTLSGSDLIDLSLEGRLLQPVCIFAPRFDQALNSDADAERLIRRIHGSS